MNTSLKFLDYVTSHENLNGLFDEISLGQEDSNVLGYSVGKLRWLL